MRNAPMPVAIDLDGCCANFNGAFVALIKEVTGKTVLLPPGGPVTWNYHMDTGGVTKEENSKVWRRINASDSFWSTLDHFPGADYALEQLNLAATNELLDVWFITSRTGPTAKSQSQRWLRRRGMHAPQVIVANNHNHKKVLALALGIQASVEDNLDNAVGFAEAGAKSFLVNWPYNQGQPAIKLHRVEHVSAAVFEMVTMANERVEK